jgi:hypothetical protein
MALTDNDTVVGVFDDRGAAARAVQELRQAGFPEDQVGVLARGEDTELRSAPADQTTTEGSQWEEGAATGVVAGAGIGALWALGIAAGVLPAIGPVIAGGVLASVLASAAGAATVGGILGALIGLGVPEHEARVYEREFHAGRTLVTVRANGRYDQIRTILRRHGARDMDFPEAAEAGQNVAPQSMQVPVRREQVGEGAAQSAAAPRPGDQGLAR